LLVALDRLEQIDGSQPMEHVRDMAGWRVENIAASRQ